MFVKNELSRLLSNMITKKYVHKPIFKTSFTLDPLIKQPSILQESVTSSFLPSFVIVEQTRASSRQVVFILSTIAHVYD